MSTGTLRIHILTILTILPDDIPSVTINAIGTDLDAIQAQMKRVVGEWRKRKICFPLMDNDSKFVGELRNGAEIVIEIASHNVPCEVTI
jgi:hypothetical protein